MQTSSTATTPTASPTGHPSPYRHPAWFGAVMGTASLTIGIASEAQRWQSALLTDVAVIGMMVVTLLTLALGPRYILRLRDRTALGAEIADTARGPMLATMPAGVLVLGVVWGKLGSHLVSADAAFWIAITLGALGTLIALIYGLMWSASMLATPIGLEQVHGGWLVPPVMNLLVPLAILPLVDRFPASAMPLLVVAGAFLGMGALLFIIIMSAFALRLIVHGPLPAPLLPSLFIPLAPAGVLGLATLRVLQSAAAHNLPQFGGIGLGLVVSAGALGFGLWWAALAIMELRRQHRAGALMVHPGWWGFVFPVGAMALSLQALAAAVASPVLEWAGTVALGIMALLWLTIVSRTARMLLVRP